MPRGLENGKRHWRGRHIPQSEGNSRLSGATFSMSGRNGGCVEKPEGAMLDEELDQRVDDYLSSRFDWDDPNLVSLYDELPLWSAMFGAVLLKNLALEPNLQVLDLGCGTGFPSLELAQRLGASSRVYGLDPWRAALERAQKKITCLQVDNLRVIQADGLRMPFGDGRFDLITSNLGLNNFPDGQAVMSECARVARSNARIVLTTNLVGHMRQFYEVFEATLKELGKTECFDRFHAQVAHRGTVDSIRRLLMSAGLAIRRILEESFTMRFLNGSALLRHSFIRIGFLEGWRSVVTPEDEKIVFARLERNLNRVARNQGELALTIPLAYIECEKTGQSGLT
jgi:arsenite methyltransferase